jgi:Tfp pilus assembly PilM family ATPase/Tfp pilus assembly protein PilN
MKITTLNISSSAIKCLVLKGKSVTRYGSVTPEGAIKNGSILQPEIIARQLKSLFAAHRIPRSKVICSINGLPFSYRLFTLPRMAPEAFNEALMRVARKEMPIDVEEMYLSWQAYPAPNNEWQVLVIGISRQPVDNLLSALAQAGIKPSYLDLQQLALVRLTSRKDAVIVDFEKDYSNIVIVAEGVPVAMQIVPSAGPDADMQDEVRQITDRINKMVEFYNGTHIKQPIRETVKILLTGGQVNDSAAVELVQQEAGYPVEPLNPELSAFAGLPLNDFAANAGSALMNAAPVKDDEGKPVPRHHTRLMNIARERAAGKKRGSIIIRLAMLVFILGGIGAMVPGYQLRSNLQSDFTRAQSDLAQANTLYSQSLATSNDAKKVEENISEIVIDTQKIVAANQAVLVPVNYESDISFIVWALPDGVSYTSINLEADSITIIGNAEKASPVVEFARNLESATGYTKADVIWITKPRAEEVGVGVSFQIVIDR